MKKSTILTLTGMALGGLGSILSLLSDKVDMKEEVKKEVDRQLNSKEEKEEA